MKPQRPTTAPLVLAAALGATLCAPAWSLEIDASCAPVFKTMQAELSTRNFHKWSEFTAGERKMKMEIIRADGQLYQRRNDGPWAKLPITPAQVDKQNADALRDSKSRISDCRRVGLDTVEGIPTTSFEYTSTPGGKLPPMKARVWIGVLDNLPYRFETAAMKQRTSYKGVSAPMQ